MVECETCGHDVDEATYATDQADMFQFLYENIEGSGIDYDTNLFTRTYADDWYKNGYLQRFDQSEFFTDEDWEQSTMARYGYVFYPATCIGSDKQCKLAIGMHGCGMTAYGWNEDWSGLASVNDLIIVYPQAIDCFETYNEPKDWGGFTGDLNYNNNLGIEPKFFKAIMERLTTAQDSSVDLTDKRKDFTNGDGMWPELVRWW